MELTYRITEVTETLTGVDLTLKSTAWEKDVAGAEPDGDGVVPSEPAAPGEPGAFWYEEDRRLGLSLPKSTVGQFHPGQQFVITLNEIVHAPAGEFEPA